MILNIRGMAASIAAVAVAFSLAGCATTFPMTPDASLPFAKGELDASFVKGGNGKMLIKVEHLGPPAKLDPAATVYVVWIKPKKADTDLKPENVGTLQVDDNYTGYLEFSTPFEAFDVEISTEKTSDTTSPSGRDVLKATIAADAKG